MHLLKGRAAVVTGGAQGIGLAIARRLLEHGARVLIADLDLPAAERTVSDLGGGPNVAALHCDVTNPDQVEGLTRACVDRFGSLDVMVNNAGITRDAAMRTMTLADFEAVIDVHLKGAWLCTRAASLVMREQRRGAIINISSISGKVGMVGQTNYSAAKSGIIGLTKAAAKELAHLGVRVNAIRPGLIRTGMTMTMCADVWEHKMAELPMQRAGEPTEVADVVVFFASDMASYVTGSVLDVSGGRFM